MTTTPFDAIIVDDEIGSIKSLLWELENFEDKINVVKYFQSPLEAIKFLKEENTIDVLFLDIEMPELNGFEMLNRLGDIDLNVIFTTAYDEYVLNALKINALDYLLKPVDENDLELAISKIKKDKGKYFYTKMEALLQSLSQQKSHSQKVVFPVQEGLEFVNVNDIIRCQSDSNYTIIYLLEGQNIIVSKTLKQVEQLLNPFNFMRIHHSHLINPIFIKKYLKGKAGLIVLEDGSQIPISRSRKGGFLDNL